MNTRENIKIISMDYDDCGDVLFDDHINNASDLRENEEDLIPSVLKCKEELSQHLQEITEDADNIELYVGSRRQDIERNEFNIQKFKNGSCFKNYAAFCKEKGWIFNKFLLADAQNNQPAGTAMKNSAVKAINKSNIREDFKVELICAQLDNIQKEHPDDDVDFYFIDDESIYLHALKKHFLSNPFPKNIRNLFLIYYDWHRQANNGLDDTWFLHTHMKHFTRRPPFSTARILTAMSADFATINYIPNIRDLPEQMVEGVCVEEAVVPHPETDENLSSPAMACTLL
jgi:hypothetical protein